MTKLLAGLFLLFVYIPLQTALDGYVLSILWAWFIVTTFHAAPLSVSAAIGVSLVVSFITHETSIKRNKDTAKNISAAITKPFVCLLVGWVVHRFFM